MSVGITNDTINSINNLTVGGNTNKEDLLEKINFTEELLITLRKELIRAELGELTKAPVNRTMLQGLVDTFPFIQDLEVREDNGSWGPGIRISTKYQPLALHTRRGGFSSGTVGEINDEVMYVTSPSYGFYAVLKSVGSVALGVNKNSLEYINLRKSDMSRTEFAFTTDRSNNRSVGHPHARGSSSTGFSSTCFGSNNSMSTYAELTRSGRMSGPGLIGVLRGLLIWMSTVNLSDSYGSFLYGALKAPDMIASTEALPYTRPIAEKLYNIVSEAIFGEDKVGIEGLIHICDTIQTKLVDLKESTQAGREIITWLPWFYIMEKLPASRRLAFPDTADHKHITVCIESVLHDILSLFRIAYDLVIVTTARMVAYDPIVLNCAITDLMLEYSNTQLYKRTNAYPLFDFVSGRPRDIGDGNMWVHCVVGDSSVIDRARNMRHFVKLMLLSPATAAQAHNGTPLQRVLGQHDIAAATKWQSYVLDVAGGKL